MGQAAWDAVVFDYGGVLCYPPLKKELTKYARTSGLDEATFLKLYNETRQYYGRSGAGYTQSWHDAAAISGVELAAPEVEQFIEKESDLWTRPNLGTIELVRQVKKAGCKTAVLSNMTYELLQILRKKFTWLDEFDVKIWSCEHGCAKPDESIYLGCLKALSTEASRTLFFDDRERNVEAARQLGIDAHVFESAAQARLIVKRGLAS